TTACVEEAVQEGTVERPALLLEIVVGQPPHDQLCIGVCRLHNGAHSRQHRGIAVGVHPPVVAVGFAHKRIGLVPELPVVCVVGGFTIAGGHGGHEIGEHAHLFDAYWP